MNKGFCALEKRQNITRNLVHFAEVCGERAAVVRFAFSAMETDHMFNAHPDSGAAHWLQYIVCTRGSVI